MVLGLFGKTKTKKETSVENTVVNESTFTALNKSTNAQSASVISKQKININGATFICKKPEIKQIANLDVKVLSKFEGKDSANLVDNIMSELDNKLDDELKQASGFLGLGGGTQSEQNTKVKNSVRNSLNKSITNETINTVASKIVVDQDLKLENLIVDPCGMYGGIKAAEKMFEAGKLSFKDFREAVKDPCDAECGSIGQDVQIKFVAEQIGSKVTEAIAQNSQVQKLKQDIKAKQEQKQQGVGEAVGDVYKGLGEGVGTAVGGKKADGSVGGIGGGVGTAAKGAGEGVGSAAKGVGSGIGAAFGGGSMPSIASASVCCVLVAGAAMFAMQNPDMMKGN
jgi:hypothetical protein